MKKSWPDYYIGKNSFETEIW